MYGKRCRVGVSLGAVLALGLAGCSTAAKVEPLEPIRVTNTQTVTETYTPVPTITEAAATPTTPGPLTWDQIVARVRPAVVRLDVAACDAHWMGSGFAISARRIMTANHVVEGASAITVQHDDGVTTAYVVARDPVTDSALIETEEPVTDTPLELVDSLPPVGEEVAVLGYPLATYELRFTKGVVSGHNEPVAFDEVSTNALVTDAAINPGNSGGPAVDSRGQIIGLVSAKRLWISGQVDGGPAEGQGYVIRADDLAPNLDRWRGQPVHAPDTCEADEDRVDAAGLEVSVRSGHEAAMDIARSLHLHGSSINRGAYEAAWELFTPRMQGIMGGLDTWSTGLETAYWRALSVESVSTSGEWATVEVALTTAQSSEVGRDGQTCSDWRITYTMLNVEGGWLIDKAKNAAGWPVPGDPVVCGLY